GKYKLTLKLYHLSHRHSPVDELRNVALTPMQELSQLLRESCHLSTLYLDKLMVILHTRSPAPIALSIEEGNLFPLPLTGSGKVLLAYMPNKKELLNKNEIFKNFTTQEKEEFQQSLKQINENGYYIRKSHLAEGVVDISVPVGINHSGIIACLTISKLTTMNMDQTSNNERILTELKKCADTITKRIGL
ncbi:IclR family transcriptional regulator, partial [Pseudoxanthomonas sp. SGD-10]